MQVNLENKKVLVTGSCGFVASNIIKQLLERNCNVRGTIRSFDSKYHEQFYEIFPDKKHLLEFVEADLLDDKCWENVISGCDYVIHVASPVIIKKVKDPQLMLDTAIKGTGNVLEACSKLNIKKVVLTSSVAAISCQNNDKSVWTDKDWTIDNCGHLYDQTKMLAEKKAWEIAKKNNLNLTVMNPGLIIGNFVLTRFAASQHLIKVLMTSPVYLNAYLRLVDVEDVALAHIRALELPEKTKGKRYILVDNTYKIQNMIKLLKNEFSPYGYKFGYIQMPMFIQNSILSIMRIFGVKFRPGVFGIFDTTETRQDLGIQFRQIHQYLYQSGYSLIKHGFLPDKTKSQKQQNKKQLQLIL